jgi:hypothetical protein
MDDELKEVVKSKFDGFEVPVNDELWSGIKKEITPPSSKSRFTNKKRWVVAVLLLFISVMGWRLLIQVPTVSTPQSVTNSEKREILADTVKLEIEKYKSTLTEGSFERATNELGEQSSNEKNITVQRELQQSILDLNGQSMEKSTLINYLLILDSVGGIKSNVTLISLPPYQFNHSDLSMDKFTMKRIEQDSTGSRKSKSNLIFGLNFNYLNLRPNPADNVFFEDINPSLDISLKRLGLNVGYERITYLGKGFNLRNELSVTLRQHKLRLNYIEDANDRENMEFTEFKNTFMPLSIGISTGVQYGFNQFGSKQKEVDLGFSYQAVVNNVLSDEYIVQYSKHLVNLHFGLTSEIGLANWKMRVFGYYSLNKKFTKAPMSLTPFGLGFQFLKK